MEDGQSNGLIHKLSVLGSRDATKFMARFPKGNREGNYELEHTPHELAFVIAVVRSHRIGARRVLSVGSGTLGAERAIVENVGAFELDVVAKEGRQFPASRAQNIKALEAEGVKVRVGPEKVSDEYDLVLLAGDDKIDCAWVLGKVKMNGLVVTLGNGMRMEWPNLRSAFFWFRNNQRLVGQTGAAFGEVGAGIVEITHKPEAMRKAKPEPQGATAPVVTPATPLAAGGPPKEPQGAQKRPEKPQAAAGTPKGRKASGKGATAAKAPAAAKKAVKAPKAPKAPKPAAKAPKKKPGRK